MSRPRGSGGQASGVGEGAASGGGVAWIVSGGDRRCGSGDRALSIGKNCWWHNRRVQREIKPMRVDAYIRRFGHVTDDYMTHIFIGDVSEPTNI
jgi:hypothetical protein